MDIFRFDRSDRIGTEVTLGLVWVMAAVSLLMEPVSRWVRGLPLLIESGDPIAVQVPVDGATTSERVIMLAAPTLAVVFLGVGAWMTVRLLRGIAAGNPFVRSQIRRLRVIAVLLIVVPSGLSLGTFVATTVVQDRLGEDVNAMFTLPVPWLLAGLLTAAVAQAFVTGASLRDDVEGLV